MQLSHPHFVPINLTTSTIQRLSNVRVEITFRNSSFMATIITIMKISLLVPVTIVCEGESREELVEYNEIPGNQLCARLVLYRVATSSCFQQYYSIY